MGQTADRQLPIMKHEKQTFTSTESQEGSGPNKPLGASVIRQCSHSKIMFATSGTSPLSSAVLARALIRDIVADVDEEARDVVLTIHWQGGQHSQLRVRKPKTGEHGCNTSEDALEVMRSMVGRWSDSDIAATLNRLGVRTGFGHTGASRLDVSLRIATTGSHVPCESLIRARAAFMPVAIWAGLRSSAQTCPGRTT